MNARYKTTKTIDILNHNIKYDRDGLLPAIAQCAKTGDILMMAYMNAESLQKTIETKEMHYWSRSREALWHKGATSGHIQYVQNLYMDCDNDAIIAEVIQEGDIACHTGAHSCFFKKIKLEL